MVVNANIKCFDWYMIYGLPYEKKEDIDCFKELLIRLDHELPLNYAIAIHWNAFTPSAQSPFQYAPVSSYQYKLKDYFNKKIFLENPSKRIKLMHKPKFTNDDTLLSRVLATRSGIECKDLLYTIARNRSIVKNKPQAVINAFKKIYNVDIMGEWPENVLLPWDKYCLYNKKGMLKAWKLTKTKYG
jgi:hypothetical protein